MKPRISQYTSYDDLPTVLTIQEVAIWLNRNYKALLLSVNQGKVPFGARKVGSQWRVNKMQLQFQEKKITQIFKK